MTVAVAVIATFNGWPFLVRGKPFFFFPLPSYFLTRLLYRFERVTFNSSNRNLRKKKSCVAGDHSFNKYRSKNFNLTSGNICTIDFLVCSFGYRIYNILERNVILKEVQYQMSVSSTLLYIRSPFPFSSHVPIP